MRERPIIMHARSVQGILAGRKVQTRRPTALRSLRTVAPGDTLWVREAWAAADDWNDDPPRVIETGMPVWYAADGTVRDASEYDIRGRWRPSIHMPRWASRLTLRVTGVRVERLHAITCADVLREGLEVTALGPYGRDRTFVWPEHGCGLSFPARDRKSWWSPWRDAWDGIYAGRGWGWDTDPEVRVIDFEVTP